MFQTVTNAPLKPKEKHVFHAESPIWFLYVLLCVQMQRLQQEFSIQVAVMDRCLQKAGSATPWQ